MRSSFVVICDVSPDDSTKVSFAEHDDVVETLPSDRADQPFDVSVAKGSQLHPVRSMGRKLSGSPMKMKRLEGRAVIPSRRSRTACRPLRFLGRSTRPLRW